MKKVYAVPVFALFICTLAWAGNANKTSTSSQTAQSIGVKLHAQGTYTFVNQKTYRFDKAVAATFFDNAWDGQVPLANCTGKGCDTCANALVAPSAPAHDPTKVADPNNQGVSGETASSQRCTFLDGGALAGSSYTQTQKVSSSCSYVNDKGRTVTDSYDTTFTWNYLITPKVSAVDPLTAWTLVKEVIDGNPSIPVDADIAGQSVVVSKQFPSGKYSFSLLTNTADPTTNRITGLTVTLSDMSGVVSQTYPATTVYFPADFTYVGNAGAYPATPNAASLCLANGWARDILNGNVTTNTCHDTFAGNNDGGSDGSAMSLAKMDTQNLTLNSGSYSLMLSGSVKGNGIDFPAFSFSVTNQVDVITPGCGSN